MASTHHLSSVTIRQLHEATGQWVRRAAEHGEIMVTERGKVIAKLVPVVAAEPSPYFSRRRLLPAFRAAKLAGGTDLTEGISQERDSR